jgi:glycosyltransferase involved in cell wall biosynthesis
MRVALFSYEFPPDTADGGIATYTWQAGLMLAQRRHIVEVFAGSRQRTGSDIINARFCVHRFQTAKRADFAPIAGRAFRERHRQEPFDIVEGPDFGADSAFAVHNCPEIPLVVKLHTPQVIIWDYMGIKPLQLARIKFGALRRKINPIGDFERRHALSADMIAAPTQAIHDKVMERWNLRTDNMAVFPLPYTPSPEILNIPVNTETNRVTFLGRLDLRKGVVDLAHAIPIVLRQFPHTKFRFVGGPGCAPGGKGDMRQFLETLLCPYGHAVEFCAAVPPNQIHTVLADSDICVFPSHWENGAYVCLEAMAAGRGVIGSKAGGMAEYIRCPSLGLLVSPQQPTEIATAICDLLKSPVSRQKIGSEARSYVLSAHNFEVIGRAQEACYEQAIEYRTRVGKRQFSCPLL